MSDDDLPLGVVIAVGCLCGVLIASLLIILIAVCLQQQRRRMAVTSSSKAPHGESPSNANKCDTTSSVNWVRATSSLECGMMVQSSNAASQQSQQLCRLNNGYLLQPDGNTTVAPPTVTSQNGVNVSQSGRQRCHGNIVIINNNSSKSNSCNASHVVAPATSSPIGVQYVKVSPAAAVPVDRMVRPCMTTNNNAVVNNSVNQTCDVTNYQQTAHQVFHELIV